MSTTQPDRTTTELAEDTFIAIAITSSRTHVLAALVEQAVAHFGMGPLCLANVSVVAVPSLTEPNAFLSYAEIVAGD